MGVYFLAGIYGVGKSTLGNELSRQMNMPFFSAGDLISEVNGETYGANKVVANKDENQSILAQRVRQLLVKHPKILLAGHFCIVNSKGKVDPLPEHVFGELSIENMFLCKTFPHSYNMDRFIISQSGNDLIWLPNPAKKIYLPIGNINGNAD